MLTARDNPHAPEGDTDPTALQPLCTVYYTWPVPGALGSLLIASVNISGQAIAEFTPIVTALTELFDAMMHTLNWARKGTSHDHNNKS